MLYKTENGVAVPYANLSNGIDADRLSIVDTEGLVTTAGGDTTGQLLIDEIADEVVSLNNSLTNVTSDIVNVLGAKNLLPNNVITQVINGVTFTVNSDGSITASGTATADANFNIIYRGTGFKPSGTSFILSGCPSGGSASTYYIAATKTVNGSGQNIGNDYGNGLEFTLDSNVRDIGTYIHVSNGVTINKTFYPMIRPSSIVDDTYAPYAMTNRELTDKITNDAVHNGSIVILGGVEYKAPCDGYLMIQVKNNAEMSVFIRDSNHKEITRFDHKASGMTNSYYPVFIKKGLLVQCNYSTESDGTLWFIKLD